MSKQAVLLIAHGSPERVEDIPEFLQNISRGRPMPEAVVREVQHRYSLIGSSPLTRITQAQAEGVARELGVPAYVGMRNWHPFIADTLRQMESDNVGQAVAICLAPHNSQTSVGLYKQVLFGAEAPVCYRFRRGVARSPPADRRLRRQAANRLGKRLPAAWCAAARLVHRAQRAAANHCRWRSLRSPDARDCRVGRGSSSRNRAVAVCLSKPGHVGRRMAGSHSGGHDYQATRSGPHRRVCAADWICLRPRRNPV